MNQLYTALKEKSRENKLLFCSTNKLKHLLRMLWFQFKLKHDQVKTAYV